jgi:hypothetical protein
MPAVEEMAGMGQKIETAWQWLAAFLPLALVAFGIVAMIFPPPTDERKIVWIAVFAALGFAAVVSTRQVQVTGDRQTATAKRAHENLLKSVHTGDGYCYFQVISVAKVIPASLELVLLNAGKFPLFDMAYSIKRKARPNSTPEEILATAKGGQICSRDYGTVHVGVAQIGYSLPYQEGVYQIDISTRNGRVCEIVRVVDRGGGELFPYVDVYKGGNADHVVKSKFLVDYPNRTRADLSAAAQSSHTIGLSKNLAVCQLQTPG